jgi:thioredoxin reductase (NADPH)
MKPSDYDLIIAGGGPAGLTAGLYAARSRMRVLLIEKMAPGGQAATTFHIENYPGFPDGIAGPDLAQAMETQARKFGLEVAFGEVKALASREPFWELEYEDRKLVTKGIIIASGVESKKLGIPGEETLRGRGVSYCGTCDGPFFKGQEIGVIGGGDSAVDEALYLTRFASRVYLIHRRRSLRAEKILQERAFQNPQIEILWDTIVTKVLGETGVEGLEIMDLRSKECRALPVSGVFFYVGLLAKTEFLKGIVNLDEQGYVMTDDNMATSARGIFAAGDVRRKILRQVATAVGDGAVAAFAAERYIESRKWP